MNAACRWRWSVGEVHIAAVSVEDAWARLKSDSRSVLIDVRTIAEWAYVGLPDLSSIGKRPVLVEWHLTAFAELWAAAGTPRHVFPIAPADLLRATGGQVADVTLAEDGPPAG